MNINNKLIQIGLTEKQARVYGALLENGLSPARYIIFKAELKRGITYEVLDQLIKLNLVEKVENHGKIALFRTTHPNNLENFFEKKKKEIKDTEEFLKNELGEFVSMYNLLSGKPNVRFFEGKEGIEKVLEETLNSKTEVLTYLNMEIVEKYFKEINDNYVKKREKLNIPKRILAIDNEYSQNLFKNWREKKVDFFKITNIKMIKTPILNVEAAMQIYDNKIGIITVSESNLISIIIEDQRISNLFKSIFEALYLTSNDF